MWKPDRQRLSLICDLTSITTIAEENLVRAITSSTYLTYLGCQRYRSLDHSPLPSDTLVLASRPA